MVAPSFGSSIAFLTAASYASRLCGFTAATFNVPSVPGKPLNFCQSPVTFKIASTAGVGSAPTFNQCCARSDLTSMKDGSCPGE